VLFGQMHVNKSGWCDECLYLTQWLSRLYVNTSFAVWLTITWTYLYGNRYSSWAPIAFQISLLTSCNRVKLS